MHLPFGKANCARVARMKAMMRSISHAGTWRHSKTALTQAGERRSKALLWSIRRTAWPPGEEERLRWPGGSQAPAAGPSRSPR
eukprot:7120827-Alexandrium_andersonii.AAC.1